MSAAGPPTRSAPSRARLGRALSAAGFACAGVAAACEVGGGLVLGAIGSAVARGAEPASVVGVADAARGVSSPYFVLLLGLAAACLLIPGEQLRRGEIGRNPVPRRTLLPSASTISRFRVLGTGWHLLWSGVGVALSLLLLIVPAVASITGAWPAHLDPRFDFRPEWNVVALAVTAITAASLVSAFKKVHVAAVLCRNPDAARGTDRRATWAFVTVRWRIDLWLAGAGGLVIGFAGVIVALVPWGDADAGGAWVLLAAVLVVGLALIGVGVWLASNYWRAGRPIGFAESYS